MRNAHEVYDETIELERERIYEKWLKTGLLQGLEEDRELADKIARLLENQATYMLANSINLGTDQEAQDFCNIVFPVIRRVFGKSRYDHETGELYELNIDWHVMSLPAHYDEETDRAIRTATYKLETEFPNIQEMAKHTYYNLDAEIEATSMFSEAVAKELEKRWKNQKIHVYVPFCYDKDGSLCMRWSSQEKDCPED